MKKKYNIFHFFIISAILILGLTLYQLFPQKETEHNRVLEEVNVDWWQVPVFAVDKAGNPVTDLETKDLEVRLDNGIITNFSLIKRTFGVTSKKTEALQVPQAQQQSITKPKVVILLFDQALSGVLSTKRAKALAQKIIMNSEEDTRFYMLTIDAFAGLIYVGEGNGSNKENLIKVVENKIVEKMNKRIVNIADFAVMMDGKRGDKYEEDDLGIFAEIASKWYKRKSMGFFFAFDTLSMFLNSFEDNKFIYLFSEGMSRSIQSANRSIAGDRGMYEDLFRRIAKKLSRSGAVVFIVNTMGVDQYNSNVSGSRYGGDVTDSFSIFSGEESLHLLTKESGGTYLEGGEEQIVEKLEKLTHAYYEIAFPDPPQIEGTTRDITVICKRKGVEIHSIKYLKKMKQYSQMNSVEKDMMVINLVTQPQNTFVKSIITAYNAQVEKTKKSKSHTFYSVLLPPSQQFTKGDLYKIYLSTDSQGTSQLQKIEKETLSSVKSPLNITFDLSGFNTQNSKSKKEKKQESDVTPDHINTYFVLVNNSVEPALAYVHGIELYDEDPELAGLLKKEQDLKISKGKTISTEDMQNILNGAADYCERLKKSAFHFYCQEKIIETRIPITESQGNLPDITKISNRVSRYSGIRTISPKVYTQVKGYLFGYRLIKQGKRIKEARDFISSRDEIPVSRGQVIKTTAFFTEKSIFAPITLLDKTRQELYNFQFLRFTHYGDRKAVVIRAIPKNPVESASIYGDVWIDMVDFSVMKIEADPKSIKSYNLLEEIAKKLRTRLHLTLEIDFNYLHDGIRFPTQVNMLEKYKGGRIIQERQGVNGWDRTRVQFSYSDYQFFSVNTEVEIQ